MSAEPRDSDDGLHWLLDPRTPPQRTLDAHQRRYGPLPSAAQLDARGLTELVARVGLSGRGGGGFPLARKLAEVAAAPGGRAIVVVNGSESEPGVHKDRALLSQAPHLVLDGAELAARAVGARDVRVCLHDEQALEVTRAAASERRSAGISRMDLEVVELPGGYVSGHETAVVRWLNGGPALPTSVPPRPAQRGVQRRPTLVSNVETLARLAVLARYGEAWYRRVGVARAPGTVLLTVSGPARTPGLLELVSGTVLADVVALAEPTEPVQAVLLGGFAGRWLDLSRDGQRALVAGAAGSEHQGDLHPGAGLVLLLPRAACGVAATAALVGFLANQSAGQCGPCRLGLPELADAWNRVADASGAAAAAGQRLATLEGLVAGRGACSHPDATAALSASARQVFARDLGAHQSGRACAAAGRDLAEWWR